MILAGFPVVSGRDAGEAQVPLSVEYGGFPGGVGSRCRRNSGAFESGFSRASRWCRIEMPAKLRRLRLLILAGFPVVSNRDAGETPAPPTLDSRGVPGGVGSRCRRNSGAFEAGFGRSAGGAPLPDPCAKAQGSGKGRAVGATSVVCFGRWGIWRRSAGSLSAQRPGSAGGAGLPHGEGGASRRRRASCKRVPLCCNPLLGRPRAMTVLRTAIDAVARDRCGESPGGVGSRCRRRLRRLRVGVLPVSQRYQAEVPAKTPVPSSVDSDGSHGDFESRCRRNSGAFESGL